MRRAQSLQNQSNFKLQSWFRARTRGKYIRGKACPSAKIFPHICREEIWVAPAQYSVFKNNECYDATYSV